MTPSVAEYRVHFNLAPAEIHVGPVACLDPAEAYELALAKLDPVLAELARTVPRSDVRIERLDPVEKGGWPC